MHRLPLSGLKLLELGNVVLSPVGIAVRFETVRVTPGNDAARRHQGDPALIDLRQRRSRRRFIPNLHRQLAFEGLVSYFLEQHLDGALRSGTIRLLQTSDTTGDVTFLLCRTDDFTTSEPNRNLAKRISASFIPAVVSAVGRQ